MALAAYNSRCFLYISMLPRGKMNCKIVGLGVCFAGCSPCKASQCMSKYFTNGRLRIVFFQPSSLLVVNDAIMGHFGKLLAIKRLCFQRFFGVANPLKSRRRYSVIASPLRCNRIAVTVQSRCRYSVIATR